MSAQGGLDEATVAKLKAEHGELVKVTTSGRVFVLRKPTHPEFRRFSDQSVDQTKRSAALEQIVRACVVYPPSDGFTAALADKPAITVVLAEPLMKLAGADEQAETEKLLPSFVQAART